MIITTGQFPAPSRAIYHVIYCERPFHEGRGSTHRGERGMEVLYTAAVSQKLRGRKKNAIKKMHQKTNVFF